MLYSDALLPNHNNSYLAIGRTAGDVFDSFPF